MTVHIFLQAAVESNVHAMLARGEQVWLVDNATNRRLAEGCWQRGGGGHALSTFAAMQGDGLSDVLELLDDHYGEFSGFEEPQQVVVHGAMDQGTAEELMGEWGFRLERALGSALVFMGADSSAE
jgi:hypothetical protein